MEWSVQVKELYMITINFAEAEQKTKLFSYMWRKEIFSKYIGLNVQTTIYTMERSRQSWVVATLAKIYP